MPNTKQQLAEFFDVIEDANNFSALEYQLLKGSGVAPLIQTVRSQTRVTTGAPGTVRSFKDKLLTSYGL